MGFRRRRPTPKWRHPVKLGIAQGLRKVSSGKAYDDGVAAPVVLSATSERALDVVPLDVLEEQSVDVPPDLSGLE